MHQHQECGVHAGGHGAAAHEGGGREGDGVKRERHCWKTDSSRRPRPWVKSVRLGGVVRVDGRVGRREEKEEGRRATAAWNGAATADVGSVRRGREKTEGPGREEEEEEGRGRWR